MSELSIQINIAGRTYPLTIKREEEERLRSIAKDIQIHVEKLRQTYAVKDNQDLLAMTLLEYASRLDSKKEEEGAVLITEALSELDSYMDELVAS
jgi:cell division protein ZapA